MATPTKDDSVDATVSSATTDKSNAKSSKSNSNTVLAKMIAQLAQDDFEEFESLPTDATAAGAAAPAHGEPALNIWEDNWDDESAETDFSKQLKEELAKHGHTAAVQQ